MVNFIFCAVDTFSDDGLVKKENFNFNNAIDNNMCDKKTSGNIRI